jgi:hypothetical protein
MAGAVRVSIPARSRTFYFLQNAQTGSVVNQVCYTMIPDSKAAGA